MKVVVLFNLTALATMAVAWCFAHRDRRGTTARAPLFAVRHRTHGNADATGGTGLTYHRADRAGQAIRGVEAVRRIAPANQDVRDVLERVKARQ